MKNKISLKNISVSFDGLTVFKDFSVEISENTAIMGPSGKGKTTLVRALMGLLSPDGGEIDFANKPRFSAVFQEDRLFEAFSALENVAAVFEKNMPKKEAKRYASEILGELLIAPEEQGKAVRDFSGGMKRRVAIARALAADHDILVLDEPYKGLDEHTRAVCVECIKKYSEDKLIILITHDKIEAEMTGAENIILI